MKGQRSEGWIGYEDVQRVTFFFEQWCNVNGVITREKWGKNQDINLITHIYKHTWILCYLQVTYNCFPQEEQVCYIELQTNPTGSRWRKVEFWEPLAHILLDFNKNFQKRTGRRALWQAIHDKKAEIIDTWHRNTMSLTHVVGHVLPWVAHSPKTPSFVKTPLSMQPKRSTSAVPMRAGRLLKVDVNRSFIWVWLFGKSSFGQLFGHRGPARKILRRTFFCFLKEPTDSEAYRQTVCPDWVGFFESCCVIRCTFVKSLSNRNSTCWISITFLLQVYWFDAWSDSTHSVWSPKKAVGSVPCPKSPIAMGPAITDKQEQSGTGRSTTAEALEEERFAKQKIYHFCGIKLNVGWSPALPYLTNASWKGA